MLPLRRGSAGPGKRAGEESGGGEEDRERRRRRASTGRKRRRSRGLSVTQRMNQFVWSARLRRQLRVEHLHFRSPGSEAGAKDGACGPSASISMTTNTTPSLGLRC